jgi:RNA polymerase sigma-70 factor (ECF subfamily)
MGTSTSTRAAVRRRRASGRGRTRAVPATIAGIDAESRQWMADLRATGAVRDGALERLHALLLRAARFEVSRWRAGPPALGDGEREDIAVQAADDALMSVLRRLGDFRGDSRFTTWAYKFALLEAAVKLRRRGWRGREVAMDEMAWHAVPGADPSPLETLERRQLAQAIEEGIEHALTPHQREVLVAIAIRGVPIDVLAERRETTRGALYKTLHDARRALRRHLGARGIDVGDTGGGR